MNRFLLIILTFALLVLLAMSQTLYAVKETEHALLVRLGRPVTVSEGAGLKTKIPFIDTVITYDLRLLPLEPMPEQVILSDQKRIEVQTYTRYRVVDALRYYQSLRTVEQGRAQLTQMVSSSLRRELGQVTLQALLSEARARVTDNVRKEVVERAAPLGIEVVDVRIHRVDLPVETRQAIYDRMKSERERQAKELRAQGFEWAQQIKSRAERERTVMLSEAQRQSKIIRGEGDADANRLFAEAFGKDPEFYKLYRSLQTYRQALADSGPTLVLSPSADFLRYFSTGPGEPSRR